MENISRSVYNTAFQLWSARSKIFETRNRLKRYTYGDQWSDKVLSPEGAMIPEYDLIRKVGKRPLTNNLIRRLVKTIIGRYRDMAQKNKWYDTRADSPDALYELSELDSRLLEEFLISGMAVQRVADDNPIAEDALQIQNVNPEHFFCNDFRDPRGHDIDLVGMLHDMSPAEVRLRFAKSRDVEFLRELEKAVADDSVSSLPVSATATGFFTPAPGRVRIVEVWSRQYDNLGRLSWWVRWFAPSGLLLSSYRSPWKHGSHPFVLKFYPLTDGEIHSFVEDVVDQQRYINRLIVLMDQILATSAKGVLLFPLAQKIKNLSWEDLGRRWAAPDAIIPISGLGDAMPQQINTSGGDSNAYRLLEMELKLFDQTAGVGSALLGNANFGSGVTGIQHYQAQVENATIALADIFSTFRSMIHHRDRKLQALAQA